jgi:hypothetical protein
VIITKFGFGAAPLARHMLPGVVVGKIFLAVFRRLGKHKLGIVHAIYTAATGQPFQ